MEIAEAEAGMMKLALEPVDWGEIARNAAELYDEVAEASGVALEIDISAAVEVKGDATRLRQAVANLVDNAIKYTPVGGRVVVQAETTDGGAIVKVSDTGIGVADAEKSKVWERLYRCDESRTKTGLGLGLSMVRAIMRAHGGDATVRNGDEGGSVFELTMPR